MREIALFVEDFAHEKVVGGLVQRLADEHGLAVRLDWRNAVRGHGQVIDEVRNYLRDLGRQRLNLPDLIVVATDANCSGWNERVKQISNTSPDAPLPPIVFAIPDPHVEKWLLLDGAAFREVFGRGCDAPGQKCNRDLYKQRLTDAIHAAGIRPRLGGIEFADDLVREMDIERAKQSDRSLQRFLDSLDDQFQQWLR